MEITDPSAGDRWNGKRNRDHQNTFAVCDSNDSAHKYQGKQNRCNDVSAFDFFDKREKKEK
jgi:hypothetical protein